MIDALAAGEGGILCFRGPPGIGKTSLLRVAAAGAGARGIRVAEARAEALERDIPFSLLRAMLSRTVLETDPAVAFRGPAGLARGLFAGAERAESGPGSRPAELVHALYWLLVNLVETEPLLLVADDLHDADRASLGALSYAAGRLDRLDLVLVAGSREASVPPPELASVFDLARNRDRLAEPRGLSRDGVESMLATRLGRTPDAGLTDLCFEAGRGNPEFVRELASEAGALGALEPARAAALAAGTLTRVAASRFLLLDDADRAVAEAIAVLAGNATVARIGSLTGFGVDGIAESLARLEAAGLAAPGLPPTLAHPTIASAVEEQTTPARRSALHAATADLLAAAGADAGIRAAHLLHVEPAGRDDRVAVLSQAAAAARRGSPDAAARFLARALAEPPPAALLKGVLLDLGRAELADGNEAGIARLREAMGMSDDPLERARVARELGRALTKRSRWKEAADLLADARSGLGGADAELELDLDASALIAAWAGGEPAGRDERLARIEASMGGDADRARGRALSTLTWMAATEATDADRVRELGIRTLREEREPGSDLLAEILVLGSLIAVDANEDAEIACERLLAETGEPEMIFAHSLAAGVTMTHRWRRGRLEEARALGAALRERVPPGLVTVLGPLALVQADLGLFDEARSACAEADIASRREQPGLGDELVQFAAARVLAWEGRHAEASAAFELAGQIQLGHGIHGPNLIAWRSQAALSALRAGDRGRARLLAAEELELARTYGAQGCLGIALVAAALTDSDANTQERLRDAIGLLEGVGLELETAAAKLELGGEIRRAGSPKAAREPLREALAIATELGATPLAELCRSELLAAGGRPRRAALSGPDSLTPSELRVAGKAAEGAMNREIADELFISVKTVEMHLRAVYRKLGIASRDELGAALGVPS